MSAQPNSPEHPDDPARLKETMPRDAIDAIPAMVWIASPKGEATFVNRSWTQYFGLSFEDILGQRWTRTVHPDDVEPFAAKGRASLATGQPLEAEVRFRRADGEYRWFLIRCVPVRERGKIVNWYGLGADIDDRRRAQEAEHRLDNELRELIEAIPAMAFSTAADGSGTFANKNWREYTGLSQEAVQGSGWVKALHPEDADPFVGHWLASVASGQPFESEVRYRRAADGHYRWFLVRAVPVRDEAGNILKWYGTSIDIDDRKSVEEKLRESEFYLAETQRLSHTGSWASGTDKFKYLSEEGFRVLGFDPRDGLPTYQAWFQRVHPDDQPAAAQLVDRIGRDKTRYETAYRLIHPDGRVRHIHDLGQPVLNSCGDVIEFIGTVMDVTDRKQAEEALRRTEKELRDLVENMPAMAGVLLPDGSHPYLTNQWREYSGLSVAETDSEGWRGAVHPEDIDSHVEKFRAAAAARRPFENEVRLRRAADGEYRWFLARIAPLCDESGNIVKWHGVLTDIEDRKRAEDALRRSEAYLAEGQRLTHTGSWGLNVVAGQALHSSAEHTRMFGYDPEKGMPSFEDFLQRVHPEDQEHVLETFQALMRSGGDLDLRYRIAVPGAPVRYMHAIGHPVLKQSGTPGEYIGITIDITERRRLEQEREKLRKLEAELAHMNRVSTMGEMAASMAHEVKQPIAAAVMNAEVCLELLQRDQTYVPELTDATSAMLRSAKRAADIIDSVRSLSRRGTPKREVVAVNDVIREINALLRNQARQKSVGVHLQLKENVPCIVGDRVQLQQVVMNLMLNAIEAIDDAGGELVVRSELTDAGEVLISVSDTGIGLPKENEGHIFEAFYTTKSQGSGMGLAISRSIVESHGGRLWATGNPDRGATFYVQLPRQMAAPA